MTKVINVKDLTNEQVAALERLVELFRRQAMREKQEAEARVEEEFTLGSRRSTVIGGKLCRREIYEDL